MTEKPSHPLFAKLYDPVTSLFEGRMEPHRTYVSRDLEGRVLTVGAGTGKGFEHLAASDADEIHAVEPDPHMRRQAIERAADLDLDVEIRGDMASELSYDDGYFDAVLFSLVLCTVPDPASAVDEAARVLREGGELRFVEHVGGSGFLRSVQEAVNPLWKHVAGGCNLDRDTTELLCSHADFEVVEAEEFEGLPPVDPLVRGRLKKL